jgi:DNA polymerase-3 subunit delta'
MPWQRIRGHEFRAESFGEVVGRGRMGHAYLFAGPAGVGKKLFAFELAKTLLCERLPASSPAKGNASDFAACDQCSSCLLVDAGTHPDLLFACRPEEKVEFPISVMRELLVQLALKPARGGRKIAIIDDADDFNEEAANCLLKTLEEPPPKSLLILIATDAERQLPTILSRCQVVPFAPVPAAQVVEFLREHEIESQMAERLARISSGSPGLALELAGTDLWTFRRDLIAELARPTPDSVALAKKWTEFNEESGKEGGTVRRRSALMIKLLVEFLQNVLLASTGATLNHVDPEDLLAIQALAARLGPERLVKMMERCLEADYQIDRRVQLVLILEALVDALGNR